VIIRHKILPGWAAQLRLPEASYKVVNDRCGSPQSSLAGMRPWRIGGGLGAVVGFAKEAVNG